jgi:ketosteroid isomerase-like protein
LSRPSTTSLWRRCKVEDARHKAGHEGLWKPEEENAMPLSQTDVAVVRRAYDALNARDPAAAAECFAEDAVWHVPGRSAIAGSHRGLDAIRRDFFERLVRLSGGSFRADIMDITAGERFVVAIQHATAAFAGRRLDITACQMMRLEGGRIVEVRSHYSDQYGLDSFWQEA